MRGFVATMAGKRAHAALQCTPAVEPCCFAVKRFPTRTRTRKQLFDSEVTRKVSATKQQDNNHNNKNNNHIEWRTLGISASELSLPLTFVTGQSFRWRSTGPSQYTGVVGSHLVSLRQRADDVGFMLHNTADRDGLAEGELRDYLNLDISLEKLYKEFTMADVRFAAVAPYLVGARLLRQNPLECLYQFICSSNNHIQRISGMVEYLAAYGPRLGTVRGFHFHAFPSLAELADVTEERLRAAGFGYRAKFIVGTTEALRNKDGGGVQWLMSLRNLSLEGAVEALCSLPGVGPKVAACIALFSLDQHHAIPVDTHVWQIAVRYLLPELAGKSLTLKLHQEVQEAFIKRFGKYAGWAHQVLFIAELSSQQALLPEHLHLPKKEKVIKVKRKVEKVEAVSIEQLAAEVTTKKRNAIEVKREVPQYLSVVKDEVTSVERLPHVEKVEAVVSTEQVRAEVSSKMRNAIKVTREVPQYLLVLEDEVISIEHLPKVENLEAVSIEQLRAEITPMKRNSVKVKREVPQSLSVAKDDIEQLPTAETRIPIQLSSRRRKYVKVESRSL